MIWATEYKHVDLVKLLLSKGSDINIRDNVSVRHGVPRCVCVSARRWSWPQGRIPVRPCRQPPSATGPWASGGPAWAGGGVELPPLGRPLGEEQAEARRGFRLIPGSGLGDSLQAKCVCLGMGLGLRSWPSSCSVTWGCLGPGDSGSCGSAQRLGS